MTPDNLARSRAVVTALRKVCPEFAATHPDLFYSTPRCPRCSSKYAEKRALLPRPDGDWYCTEIECGKPFHVDDDTQWYHEFDSDVDLLAPAHLADLFEVCDAIGLCADIFGDEGEFRATVYKQVDGADAPEFDCFRGHSTDRSEALMLAAEAAFGCGEEVAGG